MQDNDPLSPARKPTLRAPEQDDRVLSLPLGEIIPNPRQPRKQFQKAHLKELSQSIQTQGVIQPLVVRPHPEQAGRYELVAGERRLRAVTLLGWETVPVLVRQIADEHVLEAALVENLQREQLTPLEEAEAYRALMQQYGYTQETLSSRVGKDRSTIANMVRLLSLPEPLQADLESGRLSVGHARALLPLNDPLRQIALRNHVLSKGLSVRETEALAAKERPSQPTGSAAEPPAKGAGAGPDRDDIHFLAAQEALERHLGTRVLIRREGTEQDGGKIEITYYTVDDFNRIFDLLTSR